MKVNQKIVGQIANARSEQEYKFPEQADIFINDIFLKHPNQRSKHDPFALAKEITILPKNTSSRRMPFTLKKLLQSALWGYFLSYGANRLSGVHGQFVINDIFRGGSVGNRPDGIGRQEPQSIAEPNLEELIRDIGTAGAAGVGMGAVVAGPGGAALGGLIGAYAGLGPTLLRMHDRKERELEDATEKTRETYDYLEHHYDDKSTDRHEKEDVQTMKEIELPASIEHDDNYERPETMIC